MKKLLLLSMFLIPIAQANWISKDYYSMKFVNGGGYGYLFNITGTELNIQKFCISGKVFTQIKDDGTDAILYFGIIPDTSNVCQSLTIEKWDKLHSIKGT